MSGRISGGKLQPYVHNHQLARGMISRQTLITEVIMPCTRRLPAVRRQRIIHIKFGTWLRDDDGFLALGLQRPCCVHVSVLNCEGAHAQLEEVINSIAHELKHMQNWLSGRLDRLIAEYGERTGYARDEREAQRFGDLFAAEFGLNRLLYHSPTLRPQILAAKQLIKRPA
jgi:hypothetical protein